MIELSEEKKNKIIIVAFLTAFASSIYILESMIPKPLPFLKLGLANIVVLLLIYAREFNFALIISFSKTLIGGFFGGTLFNPSTLMSLGGSLVSFFCMMIFIKSSISFSIVGISIIGAVMHNIAQLFIVRTVLIKNNSVLYMIPLLIILGLITGVITGVVTMKMRPFFNNVLGKLKTENS